MAYCRGGGRGARGVGKDLRGGAPNQEKETKAHKIPNRNSYYRLQRVPIGGDIGRSDRL